jgi:hypothetical protein
MQSKVFAVLLGLLPLSLFGQTEKTVLMQEVNQQIWLPFLEGVNTGRDSLYVHVHSRDFYWVAGGSPPRIMNFKEYEDDSRRVMENRRKQGTGTTLAVRFLDRTLNGEFAAEKCVFAYTSRPKNGPPQTSYSIAHIFSRKENGTWKMLVQSVVTEPANEETFRTAAAMDKLQ